MRWAQRLTAIFLTLLAAYSAYWFYAANRATKILHNELLFSHNSGTGIILERKTITGYPLKFKLDTGDISVETYAKPYTKIKAAPLNIYSRPWSPARVHISHKGQSQFDVPAGFSHWAFQTDVSSAKAIVHQSLNGDMKAFELKVRDLNISPPLNAVQTDPLAATREIPPIHSVKHLDVSFKDVSGRPWVKLDIDNLYVDPDALGQFGLALGEHIAQIDGTLSGTAINAQTGRIELWQPAATLSTDDTSLIWGPADFGARFDLINGSTGVNGSVSLSLANHHTLLSRLLDVGILSSQERFAINLIMAGAAETEDGRKQITLKVVRNDVFLGPVKIGKLPT